MKSKMRFVAGGVDRDPCTYRQTHADGPELAGSGPADADLRNAASET
jgi:hypothetical protein